MSDSLEPPAKRARLMAADADASLYGASFDAPGSPVDDMDDDFYDNTPVKPAAQPVAAEGTGASASSMFAAAAPGPASFNLPGLGGSMSGIPTQTQPASNDAPAAAEAAGMNDGELSDTDAFYHEQSAVPGVPNQVQPASASPPHGSASHPALHPVSLTYAHDAPPVDNAPAAQEESAAVPEESDGDDLALAIANGLAEESDGKAQFLHAAEANKDNKDAEWQLDSDASESGDSSDSSSDDSSDEEGSDDGELLDPEETVRLLMAESADEPGATKAKVKTLNEVEEQYEKPDITVTAETKISELGKVESIVENIVVVKAKVSGDLQVLESGSALCLQDRTVIGNISEQIGRVEEPRYALGFNEAAEITTLGIAKDTPIYYVDDHSTFVFTEPLRAQKHTDASNLHDEETNDVEFSDDEKEAEYKREQKAKKRARQDDDREPPVEKPIPTGPKGHVDVPAYYRPMEYQGGGLKYSDDEDEDLGMYKPLARPDHFEQIVGHGAPLEDRSHVRRGMMRGRGPWGDRGRGFRGRGGMGGRGDFSGGQNDRGGHGGGRGDFSGGRGDRGGNQGNQGGRGGAQGGRTDRTCYACGQVGHQKRECPTLKPQLDRGRQQNQNNQQQDNNPRNGQFQDQRSHTSASPARNQDRGQSQQSSQPQHSPPAKSKNKNRKQRLREKKEKEREQQQQQQQRQQSQQHASPAPTAPSNANSYANNSATGWPQQQYSTPPQPAAAYAPPPPVPAVQAPYAAPMPYAQAPAPAPAPVQQPGQNQQASWAAWAQWLQVVQTMQQQQAAPQAAVPAPPPPQPQAQPPPQYAYPAAYQQYAQPQQPPAQPQQQPDQSAQSLHDILRALGGGGGGQR
jgi:H/ACA ribonucleoprotein complex non-core subunit NAF1